MENPNGNPELDRFRQIIIKIILITLLLGNDYILMMGMNEMNGTVEKLEEIVELLEAIKELSE